VLRYEWKQTIYLNEILVYKKYSMQTVGLITKILVSANFK